MFGKSLVRTVKRVEIKVKKILRYIIVHMKKMGFNKKYIQIGSGILAVVLILSGTLMVTQSKKTQKVVETTPGMSEVLEDYFSRSEDESADILEYVAPTVTKTDEEEEKETSFYDTVAIAQVDSYVNVRSGPSTDSEVVGLIRNNCAATINSEENGWYSINSGNVMGYIKAEYFITGDEAEAKAREVGFVNATVTAQVLNVRDGQGTDSNVIASLMQGEVYDVVEYGNGWVYLSVDAGMNGWVSMEYVTVDVEFDTALTLAEESQRLAEERRLAEAARQSASSNQNNSAASVPSVPYVDTADKAALRQAVVNYAIQFEGLPYIHGGRSLATGTDCSGFTSLVYAQFGYSLSPASSVQPSQGTQVGANINNLLPGDILYRAGQHVALYIGNGQVIHESTPGKGCVIAPWNYSWWTGAIRVIN